MNRPTLAPAHCALLGLPLLIALLSAPAAWSSLANVAFDQEIFDSGFPVTSVA